MNLDRILLLCCLLPYLLFTKPNQYRWELLKVDQCHAAKFKMFSSWSMKDSPVKKKQYLHTGTVNGKSNEIWGLLYLEGLGY